MSEKKYKKSHKHPEIIEERKYELEELIKLANSDPRPMKVEELLELSFNYAKLLYDKALDIVLFDISELYLLCADGLTHESPPSLVDEKRQFFIQIQSHIRVRLENIFTTLKSGKVDTLIEVDGPVKIDAQYYENNIFYNFILVEPRPFRTKELNLEHEKKKVDEKFINIINDLDVWLDHIKKCLQCGNFFFQRTAREKKYCSPRCAGKVRQERYQGSAGKGGDKEKKTDT